MRAALTPLALAAALCFSAPTAFALGFGRITNATELGQPLNFAAAVRLDPDELLPRECVSAEVLSGENKLLPTQIRVTLEGAPDAQDRSVRVTTSALIDEPVVTVSVTLGCGAKITRRFVAFIDPPLINAAQTTPMETLPPQRNDSQVAPIVTMVQGDSTQSKPAKATPRAERPATPNPRPRPRVATTANATSPGIEAAPPKPAAARKPTVSRQPVITRNAGAGPRLQLEAATALAAPGASAPGASASSASTAKPATPGLSAALPPVAATAPASSASGAAALAVASAASAPKLDEQSELIAKERQRIQMLEEGLAALRAESAATQKALVTMQGRLKEAESERYANPLVYALAWLSALLALAVAGLWWRQSRVRGSPQWWSAPATAPKAPAARAPAKVDPLISAPAPLGATPTAADAFEVLTVIEDDEPRPPPKPSVRPTMPMTAAPSNEPARELSVEELIDLEQQAEFFVVLGQDEAAIELLMSHVRNDGGISPLPYLKLLEIYRRRGDADAYERIRERFNRRFNAYAPDWSADLQHGQSLLDYPDTMGRLQSLWSSPAKVMETLEASLFRRNKSDETFDLPAYRELLFLYSIARDLAEHGGSQPSSEVDLLLPLQDESEMPISRLEATPSKMGEFQHSEIATTPLDLDVSFAPEGDHQHLEASDATDMPTISFARVPEEQSEEGNSNFIDFDLSAPINPGKIKPTKAR
jgi:pilus assembly protein FimV